MQDTTQEFLQAQSSAIRPECEWEICCDVANTQAHEAAEFTPGGGTRYSSPPHGASLQSGQRAYATFEPMRMLADGALCIAPEEGQPAHSEGFVSHALCGKDGVFAAPPVVECRFAQLFTLPALTLCFGRGEALPTLCVTAYSGDERVFTQTLTAQSDTCLLEQSVTCTRLEIAFLSMSRPHCRARLTTLLFGYGARFTQAQLGRIHAVWQRDVLSRSLPAEKLTFTVAVDNTLTDCAAGQKYDAENPNGIWPYLEQPCALTARCGYRVNERTHWVTLGHYRLTGTPKCSGVFLTLSAQGVLGGLQQPYTDKTYSGQPRTLYALAQQVLDAAALPPPAAGIPAYSISPQLQGVTTAAPLPNKPIAQCLQYIAHAGGCMLYTSREGTVCLHPAPDDAQARMHLPLSQQMQKPAIGKIAVLHAVRCKVYAYTADENGVPRSSTAWYTYTVPQTPADGAVEDADNPLITDEQTAREVCLRTAAYVGLRTTYTVHTRGLPAIEPGDAVSLQTAFLPAARAWVVKNELTFDGGLQGTLTAKKLPQQEETE